LLVAFFGILAGLLTVAFNGFPNNDLWVFSSFSSGTLGFWMFSVSILVLFSEKRLTASINTALYVFIMFIIYYFSKIDFTLLELDKSITVIFLEIGPLCLFCLFYALICGGLGAILWSGKKEGKIRNILIVLPLAYIFSEMCVMGFAVFSYGRYLFQTLIDLMCVIVYIIIFRKRLCKLATAIYAIVASVLLCIYFFMF